MKAIQSTAKLFCAPLLISMVVASGTAAWAEGHSDHDNHFYQQHNLVSDGFVSADHTDPNMINAWGVAFNPFGFVWIADNGSGVSTLYDGDGQSQSLVVSIPSAGSVNAGNPTGIVYNGSSGFVVSNGTTSGPSRFLFANEDGAISGWAPNVILTQAVSAIDNSSNGAVYKGLALSAGNNGNLLYAADFHNNLIDVFDSTFKPVPLAIGAFFDPSLPAGFAPFGLQAINGDIYVTYAKQDANKHDDVKGKGLGFVNVFDPNGRLIKRFASGGKLNAPWGIALAPASFGRFGGRLLIANFGDGRINAYDQTTGKFVGPLESADHKPIQIEGLWGIAFGNGFQNQSVDSLFFAAGPGDEEHGLYGRIDLVLGGDQHHKGHASDDR